MSNLSLVQTNELLEELVRRHDAVVLTGIKFTKTNGEYITFRRYSGNRFMCNGLMSVLESMICMEEFGKTLPMDESRDR